MNFVHHQNLEAKPAMSGKAIATWLKFLPPDGRSVAALSLTRDTPLTRLTRNQAARLTDQSPYNLSIASLATADERDALMRGVIRLSDVRRVHAHARELPDAEAAKLIINRYSASAIMAAFERLTAPTLSVAAE
jgi:hypothetical protein